VSLLLRKKKEGAILAHFIHLRPDGEEEGVVFVFVLAADREGSNRFRVRHFPFSRRGEEEKKSLGRL